MHILKHLVPPKSLQKNLMCLIVFYRNVKTYSTNTEPANFVKLVIAKTYGHDCRGHVRACSIDGHTGALEDCSKTQTSQIFTAELQWLHSDSPDPGEQQDLHTRCSCHLTAVHTHTHTHTHTLGCSSTLQAEDRYTGVDHWRSNVLVVPHTHTLPSHHWRSKSLEISSVIILDVLLNFLYIILTAD